MNIDATDLILGRMAAIVAKRALLGETINIVNCEEAVVTGRRLMVIDTYTGKRRTHSMAFGPHYPTTSDRIVRRTVRGMLDYKQERGGAAYKRVKCFRGVPVALEKEKCESIPAASIKIRGTQRYVKIKEISRLIGGKS